MDPPDLIILDINLPEAQTVDLIKSLRAEMVPPILLLTPPRSEENITEAYKAGVDDYLIKPVSPSMFNAQSESLAEALMEHNHEHTGSGESWRNACLPSRADGHEE